ncbi:MAG: preprotein translocase subunit SecE [Terracidiphilus sp.]
MSTKAAVVNGNDEPSQKRPALVKRQSSNGMGNPMNKAIDTWKEFTQFLSNVRGEMRKVVTPSRKEVQATTSVVLVAVFLFGLFFFVADWIFGLGLGSLLSRLSGSQR